jgi:hypothetical protein
VGDQIGRNVVKAWNAIWTGSFDAKRTDPGDPDRVAIPVAGDDQDDRALALPLVRQTGFDAYDAGPLHDSWRQQPGSPIYCTDLTTDPMGAAQAAAGAARSPRRRDLSIQIHAVATDAPTRQGQRLDGHREPRAADVVTELTDAERAPRRQGRTRRSNRHQVRSRQA